MIDSIALQELKSNKERVSCLGRGEGRGEGGREAKNQDENWSHTLSPMSAPVRDMETAYSSHAQRQRRKHTHTGKLDRGRDWHMVHPSRPNEPCCLLAAPLAALATSQYPSVRTRPPFTPAPKTPQAPQPLHQPQPLRPLPRRLPALIPRIHESPKALTIGVPIRILQQRNRQRPRSHSQRHSAAQSASCCRPDRRRGHALAKGSPHRRGFGGRRRGERLRGCCCFAG